MSAPFFRLAILLALLLSCTVWAEVIEARVLAVADGDTLTLLDAHRMQHKIRVAYIDAPEKAQPFGQRAKANISLLSFEMHVWANCYKRDRYGKEVCIVYVDGKDVGLAQLDAGLAWWYRRYGNEQLPKQRGEYKSAEDRAAADDIGLWADPDPVPPWEWRKGGQK